MTAANTPQTPKFATRATNRPGVSPSASGAEIGAQANSQAVCSCGHRVMWHHDTRGCGYFGYSEGARCTCRMDPDAVVESLITARVDAALAPVRELADEWQAQTASAVKVHCGRRLRAALDRQEDHR